MDDAQDQHEVALTWLEHVAAEEDEQLVTHAYVVTETIAVLHRRFGIDAVRSFVDDLLPVCEVRVVDPDLHARATVALLAASGKRPSFVDRVSFELMRELRTKKALAFDRDFPNEGFQTVP